MALGFLYKAIAGSIFMSFAIIPAIADPKGFTEAVVHWWGNISPVFGHLIGGVV